METSDRRRQNGRVGVTRVPGLSVAMAILSRFAAPVRLLCAVTATLLATVYILRHGPASMGDTAWYFKTADWLVSGSAMGTDPFTRPIGYPAFLALVDLFLPREHLMLGVALLHALFLGIGAWIAGRVATLVVPERPVVSIFVTAVVAFNPTAIQNAGIMLTEPLILLLMTAWAWSFASWWRASRFQEWSGTAWWTVAVGLALSHMRLDLAGLACLVWTVVFVAAGASGGRPWMTAGRVAATGLVLTLIGTLPVSLWASSVRGEPTWISGTSTTDPNHDEFGRWATTMPAHEKQWKDMMYNEHADLGAFPDSAFRLDAERERTQRLLDELRDTGTSPDLERRWRQLRDERIRSAPVSYYVGLPLRRSLEFWFFRSPIGEHAWPIQWVLGAYYGAYALLFGTGFLACFWFALRPSGPLFVLAWLTLLRTYTILGAGVLTGHGFYDQRYVRCTQPIVLLIAVLVLWRCAAGLAEKLGLVRKDQE